VKPVNAASRPTAKVELINARAYRLFELRGRQPGHALDDWLLAERDPSLIASPDLVLPAVVNSGKLRHP